MGPKSGRRHALVFPEIERDDLRTERQSQLKRMGRREQGGIPLYTHRLNHSSISCCARTGKLCGPGKVNVENRSGFPIAW